ncbi:MAG: hypothetical protein ABFC62_08185 [Clostridiaceae bacterium]|nr:hypothetical protein [Eubacteriales bacterium]
MRKFRLFCLMAALLLLFAGCSKKEEETVRVGPLGQNGTFSGELPEGFTGGDMSGMGDMPQWDGQGEPPQWDGQGARPSGRPEGGEAGFPAFDQAEGDAVYGRVETIVGNKVTLTLGEYGADGVIVYGEETADYLLPVGMAIGSGDFTSVAKGMVLKLTVESLEDGSENITSVSIVSR